MKVALLGYSSSGKSTLFRAVAGPAAKGTLVAVTVPDSRFDAIVEQVKPKKATPATVVLDDNMDVLEPRGKMFPAKLLEAIRNAELLLLVARAFDNPTSPYHTEIDPARDVANFLDEGLLTDLQLVENRLERLQKSSTVKNPGSPDHAEKMIFDRLRPELEAGRGLRSVDLSEEDLKVVKNYQFLTIKPVVVAINVGEGDATSGRYDEVLAGLAANGVEGFVVCAKLEEELASLDADDQAEFLSSYGLTESAAARMVQAVYRSLGLVTFFTAGENETRAWPLVAGSSALKAAGTIHNDIAKGFIRCEVVSFAEYQTHGSLDAAYKAGAMRLEGKEYVVQDGDLLHIRNKS